jgi:hypothetical protein
MQINAYASQRKPIEYRLQKPCKLQMLANASLLNTGCKTMLIAKLS